MRKIRDSKSGQSILEYVLIFTAVIAVVLAIASGTFKQTLTNSLTSVVADMGNVASRIAH